MAVSKNRKNHKTKVANRNSAIKQQKINAEKKQREFIMNLIEEEKKKGLFDNDTPANINGPSFGPSLSFDGDLLSINDVIETPVEVSNTNSSM